MLMSVLSQSNSISDILAHVDRLNLNVDSMVQDVRDICDVLDSLPSLPFADNTILTGIIAGFNAEHSMAQNYKEFFRASSEFHVELCKKFDTVQQLYHSSLLTAQNLDDFDAVLSSLVDVECFVDDMISTNQAERGGHPLFF